MYVFMGEKGDTDLEELISGSHKTVIMKGILENGSEGLLRSKASYHRGDVVPAESPLIVCTSNGIKSDEIVNAIKAASKAAP